MFGNFRIYLPPIVGFDHANLTKNCGGGIITVIPFSANFLASPLLGLHLPVLGRIKTTLTEETSFPAMNRIASCLPYDRASNRNDHAQQFTYFISLFLIEVTKVENQMLS